MMFKRFWERLKTNYLRGSPLHRVGRTKTLVSAIVCLSFLLFIAFTYHFLNSSPVHRIANPPEPAITCRMNNLQKSMFTPKDHTSKERLHIGARVLVFVESQYSKAAKQITSSLQYARIDYKLENTGHNLPTLTHSDKGRFAVIIFESLEAYVNMDNWNRQLLDKYCQDYKVGMIIFVHSADEYGIEKEKVPGLPLILRYNVAVKDYRLNAFTDIWRITKPGETVLDNIEEDDWVVFEYNHSTYEPLSYAKLAPPPYLNSRYIPDNSTVVCALLDRGTLDGIQRIFFGNDLSFWVHQMIFIDGISYLSHGKLSFDLERYILVDVDDIFVGITGTRMTAEDVEAMAKTQERLQKEVSNFHFNLGFSGWFYQHGTSLENAGDQKILEYRNKFWWFGHMWRHEQGHKFDQAKLETSMIKNYQFAKEHDIPVMHQYAVAPHHSGVYPVHEPLYQAWKNVWDIRVTSTEEYPRLYPSWKRRGFIHKRVMVLPRQTCGLFTKTLYIDTYPGGRKKLDDSIQGGELFKTFLYNPINIYMTHMGNYANDRLALYTFESVIKFVKCWTNLKLKQVTPLEMGIKYFEMYPEDKEPVWQDPCVYKRHLQIWSANKSCDRLPKFLVVGPQKTGTTALYKFLQIHPAILANYNSPETFEEVQFFNGNNYHKGIDWYMEFFPVPGNATSDFLFEKSANYFDGELVPYRVHSLLPKIKIICILIDPAKRAYSWYQHMQAHGDHIAGNYTFHEIITAPDSAPRKVRELRNRSLIPGIYVQHLQKWLEFFPSRQIFIIDGGRLKSNPVAVMHNVQRFLHIEPHYDYNDYLRFDSKKGFFCQVSSTNKSDCLGRSKGRHYPPMNETSVEFLKQFYRKNNVALSKLLSKHKYRIPDWLEKELSD
ncbi:bifunctional heparan sulfate N-deacetylase/N-sulfotransferase-like [Mytilus galloprovincialis]|uniref:bifunctional heparan sulfate N-deacetylase/N-sulfotransferase-like n=1 Tax=Mytilus galloprovincialis TaxID=29158 RepID=UPI003F7C579A